MTEHPINICSVCYNAKGIILSSCGCFICPNCLQSVNKSNPKCPQCSKSIDFRKVLDLRVKDNIKKIDFIFDEPELHLKKIIESIAFQKMHQKKYINFLQSKIEVLTKENNNLKATLQTSASSFYLNNNNNCNNISISNKNRNNTNSNNMSYCNTRDMSMDMSPIPTKVIDMAQIRKIEPKRGTMNPSNKHASVYTPMNINNLNAQTASGQFSNNPNKGILNVNINNNNSNKANPSTYVGNKYPYQTSPDVYRRSKH